MTELKVYAHKPSVQLVESPFLITLYVVLKNHMNKPENCISTSYEKC